MKRLALFTLSLCATGLCSFAYYDRYFKWRDCFNELGRCFDPVSGTVMLQQSGLSWGSLAVLGAVITLYQLWALIRMHSS
ncbi:hypothetical protein Q4555_06630 [Octadecabacter sp. 1_MG-2023]|uniref:hypothetical protein n=1 Tax=unclassified Octadecabacter TaxID=196158 RepID=UPI001C095204|nr:MULTISPECIES: hypothetical protein [unclassified Octadecabacter]MBU2994374.1 hypothetical protein [Octadecabacter sp. B2R22]MDO6734336.1 hypothetical protein [Octadecabacter sp. 1_MG-2023]